ncbi:AAA family ATPase [Yersinia enterocolitica]
MQNWRLSKLEINKFKAFSKVSFDFDNCSLLTFEGPNGYGKTSVFDSLELLFTGSISRINRLCDEVMPKSVKNYSDNLFWNTKNGEGDLVIKAELTKNNEKIYIARVARVASLKKEQNNKANNFSIFELYVIDSFESEVYENTIGQDYIDGLFGQGFSENYTLLNYLEQGQSAFVYSTDLVKRKNYIGGLMNVNNLSDNMSKCLRIERKLSTHINRENKIGEIATLTQKLKDVSLIDNENNPVEYERLTNKEVQPDWDKENPLTSDDGEFIDGIRKRLLVLKTMVENNNEILIKVENIKIDNFISTKSELIESTVLVGAHIGDYGKLINLRKLNDEVNLAISKLSLGGKDISLIDLDKISKTLSFNIDDFKKNIILRNNYYKEVGEKNTSIIAINKSRAEVIRHYNKINNGVEHNCALCGQDWITKDLLMEAITIKETAIKSSLDEIGIKLDLKINTLNSIIQPEIIRLELELTKIKYDPQLLANLEKYAPLFDKINNFNQRLSAIGVSYPNDFTLDLVELEQRKLKLTSGILEKKSKETIYIDPDWNFIFNESFKDVNDFKNLDLKQVNNKIIYFNNKVVEVTNKKVIEMRTRLLQLTNNLTAHEKVKDKISKLKENLTSLNKTYSMNTISDIELTFHIYSGRLIQSYQRGLGLFIDYGDGTKLRFCTAEQSEHDATLSMSSGQLSALSLAFFLSLNKVYAQSPFVLIDDPAQSLDDINVASLSDLLRSELKNRQLFLSSHEDNISGYIRFRFMRAGLKQKPFHMQTHLVS